MELQKQVCTLQQAQRLKELGVKQVSHFGYIEIPDNGTGGVKAWWQDSKYALINTDIILYVGNGSRAWSAFTVAELGVMLPVCFNSGSTAEKGFVEFIAICYGDGGGAYKQLATEAEARAALLIHLIETGKVTPEEVNQRLLQ